MEKGSCGRNARQVWIGMWLMPKKKVSKVLGPSEAFHEGWHGLWPDFFLLVFFLFAFFIYKMRIIAVSNDKINE